MHTQVIPEKTNSCRSVVLLWSAWGQLRTFVTNRQSRGCVQHPSAANRCLALYSVEPIAAIVITQTCNIHGPLTAGCTDSSIVTLQDANAPTSWSCSDRASKGAAHAVCHILSGWQELLSLI